MKNTGKNLESWILAEARKYESKGKLMLRKADPPSFTRQVRGKVIHQLMANPFPDFVGMAEGRMLCIEAKSTKEKRLAFGKSGLRQKQLEDLRIWEKFGAICGVIWDCGEFVWISLDDIMTAETEGRKSVLPIHGSPITSTNGHVLDFHRNIQAYMLEQ